MLAATALTVAAALPATPVVTAAPVPSDDWSTDGAAFGAGSSNVRADGGAARLGDDGAGAASAGAGGPLGIAIYPPHPLRRPATALTADADLHGAEVDARFQRGDGTWSQWLPLPATFTAAATEVQLRAVLTGTAASVTRITAHPDGTAEPEPTTRAALSYRLYATREGLVGHKTADGHGDYSVRVCANHRCEWAPVWDVGPWNTTDDHWSVPGKRQRWRNLPQGMPEAQAAYRKGYNKGKDQYGRKVSNPAGIDLADGTFADGLRLKGNALVSVTYEWTAGGPAGSVRTDGIPLNVRSGASSATPNVGLAANHTQVRIDCRVEGLWVSGTFGRSNVWYRLAPGMYVAAVYVSGASGVHAC